jgi:hypothetical protein
MRKSGIENEVGAIYRKPVRVSIKKKAEFGLASKVKMQLFVSGDFHECPVWGHH